MKEAAPLMRMPENSVALQVHTIEIDSSVDRVWGTVVDAAHWSEWRASVRRLEIDAGNLLTEAAEGIVFGTGNAPSVRFRVVDCRPPYVLTFETKSPGQRTRTTYELEGAGSRCRVTFGINISGPLGSLLGTLGGRVIRRDLAAEAERLKHICETGV